MAFTGAKVVLACCFLLHLCSQPMYNLFAHVVHGGFFILVGQGIAYFFYPVIGWFTDVCLTRHRALKWALLLAFVCTSIQFLASCGLIMTATLLKDQPLSHNDRIATLFGVLVYVLILCTGLFDANAIQFGLDQMLEASTGQLIAFIQWYYWCHKVGMLVLFYLSIIGFGYLSSSRNDTLHLQDSNQWAGYFATAFSFIQLVCFAIGLCIFLCSRKYFYVMIAGLHPLRMVYRVLRYKRQHRIPENRSAFTYREEDIPSHINLGKEKEGGREEGRKRGRKEERERE